MIVAFSVQKVLNVRARGTRARIFNHFLTEVDTSVSILCIIFAAS